MENVHAFVSPDHGCAFTSSPDHGCAFTSGAGGADAWTVTPSIIAGAAGAVAAGDAATLLQPLWPDAERSVIRCSEAAMRFRKMSACLAEMAANNVAQM